MSSNGIRTRWAAIGAACAVALCGGGYGVVRAVVDSGERAIYVPIEPNRVLDTRSGAAVNNSSLKLDVEGTITPVDGTARVVVPDDASAVAINVTVTEGQKRDGYGYVTTYPCTSASDAPPNASSLNFENGVDIANALNVTTSENGSICLYVWGTADLIVDVVGYYADHNHDELYPRWSDLYSSIQEVEQAMQTRPAPQSYLQGEESFGSGYDIDTDVDFNGRAILVQRSEPLAGGNSVLNLVRCTDFGCSGYNALELTDLGGDPIEPSIELDASGLPIIAYYESAAPYGLRLVRCDDQYCVTMSQPVVLTTGVDNGREPTIATLVDGGVLIAYRVGSGTSATLAAKRAMCNVQQGACDTIQNALTTADGGYDPSIVISPTGIPFIVHFRSDGANSRAFVTRCSNTWCAAADFTSEFMGPSGGDATLTADGGLLVVGHHGSNVYFIRCLGQDCTPGPSNYARYTKAIGSPVSNVAIVIGEQGLPVGVYSDNPGTGTRLVSFSCYSFDCLYYDSSSPTSYNSIWTTRVQYGYFEPRGQYADIVVTSNGRALLFDQATDPNSFRTVLGVTSCANPYCLPYIRTP